MRGRDKLFRKVPMRSEGRMHNGILSGDRVKSRNVNLEITSRQKAFIGCRPADYPILMIHRALSRLKAVNGNKKTDAVVRTCRISFFDSLYTLHS